MRRFCGLVLLWVAGYAWAGDVPPLPGIPPLPVSVSGGALPAQRPGAFDLHFVTVGQVVDLVYGEALKVPHVISADVLNDGDLVSFQFSGRQADLRKFFLDFLSSQGFEVVTRDGVDFVSKSVTAPKPVDRDTYVYVPRYRSAEYLAKLLGPLFGQAGTAGVSARPAAVRGVSSGVPAAVPVAGASAVRAASGPLATVPPVMPEPVMSARGGVVAADDQLVMTGTRDEVAQAKVLLPELDTSAGQVVVRGWAYEVDDTGDTNSGFSIASHLLGVGLNVSSGSTAADSNALTFSAGRLSFAISAMNADSRFHQVSSPNVRCVSGQQVKLNVGQQVPTVSSISYEGTSGTPVQSVEYQDAGVIFNVTPTVMRDVIELSIDEELSSFVNTTTGVNGSPTKNTRSLQTVADMKDGEVIVLGGLIQDSDTTVNSRERFFPHFLDGHSTSKTRTEVVLVLQVQKV